MRTADIENFLGRGLALMGLCLQNQPAALARLACYFQELQKWNRKINLVARTLDDQQILEKHFLDSLTLLALLRAEEINQETILDVGTGAGFPGLVLKAACPTLAVTLLEPRKNRFFFLKHIARILHVTGVEVLDIRLEERAKVKELEGRKFSLITSRAFSDIRQFIELAAPFLEKEGRIVLMKGPGGVDELRDLGGKGPHEKFLVAGIKKLRLPFSGGERLLISIKASGAGMEQQPA